MKEVSRCWLMCRLAAANAGGIAPGATTEIQTTRYMNDDNHDQRKVQQMLAGLVIGTTVLPLCLCGSGRSRSSEVAALA